VTDCLNYVINVDNYRQSLRPSQAADEGLEEAPHVPKQRLTAFSNPRLLLFCLYIIFSKISKWCSKSSKLLLKDSNQVCFYFLFQNTVFEWDCLRLSWRQRVT